MINTENPNVPEFIREALRNAMMKEFDKLKNEMVQELERHRDEIVAGLMVHVASKMSMRDMGQFLEIRIEKLTSNSSKP